MLSKQLGRVNYFNETQERELLNLKEQWGWSDPRNTKEFEDCDICANDIFRDSWKESGVERKAFDAPPEMGPSRKPPALPSANGTGSSDQEALVQAITERVMAELAKS